VPDSIQSPPLGVSGLPKKTDRRLAGRVILEILRQAPSEGPNATPLTREALALFFWFAHLYYAKSHPGYLTNWPLVRIRWGIEIKGLSALLADLVEEECVGVNQLERGPFSVTVYHATDKDKEGDSELSEEAVGAIQRAVNGDSPTRPFFWGWPGVCSRAWQNTPEGEEMDIYLDLIPEDQYEERRRQLEGLRESLGELFS
jgi:hypothetical protein